MLQLWLGPSFQASVSRTGLDRAAFPKNLIINDYPSKKKKKSVMWMHFADMVCVHMEAGTRICQNVFNLFMAIAIHPADSRGQCKLQITMYCIFCKSLQ